VNIDKFLGFSDCVVSHFQCNWLYIDCSLFRFVFFSLLFVALVANEAVIIIILFLR